jgi:NYN domain
VPHYKRGNEQKMVDVHLAVDALLMASRGLFGSCTLITGDLDFKPLVSALVEMGVDVRLLYPKDETNDDLKAAADSAEAVTIDMVRNWSSHAQGELFPSVGFAGQNTVFKHSNRLVGWRDDSYGDCYVANDSGVFELITERSPQTLVSNALATHPHQTHRLHIKASTAVGLSVYAEEKFDLIVPEIASAV